MKQKTSRRKQESKSYSILPELREKTRDPPNWRRKSISQNPTTLVIKSLNKLVIEEKFLNWIKGIYEIVESQSRAETIMGGEVKFTHVNNSVERLCCNKWQKKEAMHCKQRWGQDECVYRYFFCLSRRDFRECLHAGENNWAQQVKLIMQKKKGRVQEQKTLRRWRQVVPGHTFKDWSLKARGPIPQLYQEIKKKD